MGAVLEGCCVPGEENKNEQEIEQLIKTKKHKKNALSVSILTWNVGCQLPKDSNNSMNILFKHKKFNANIVVIGLQEVIELNATNMVIDNNDSAVAAWQNKIQQLLNSKSKKNKYVFLQAMDLIGILLLVFVRNNTKAKIQNVISSDCATGFLGIAGNKGAVGIRFDIFGKSICFICCHLAAHKSEVKARNDNYNKIIKELTFSKETPKLGASDDVKTNNYDDFLSILDHDFIFVFGDLNYRLDYDANELQNVYKLIKQKKWNDLLFHDQLLNAMRNKDAFDGFYEHKIKFQPTYKFELGTNDYEQIKKRIPSYCDRILWKTSNKQQKICCMKYDTYLQQNMSDHKPVIGLYRLES